MFTYTHAGYIITIINGGNVMKNIGNVDRIIRVIIGLGLLSLLLVLNGNVRFLGLLGLIPIITALIGFCPLYTLFGIKTSKKKE